MKQPAVHRCILLLSQSALAVVFVVGAALADSPSTRPTTPAEEARLHRGQLVRNILRDAIEDCYQHGGVWPEKLPSASMAPGLDYARPNQEVAREGLLAAATVVVNESLQTCPAGVWVGYADGHLEFALDAPALAACKDQQRIARAAIPIRDALRIAATKPSASPPGPSGRLKLKIVDAEGQPVAGALVGVFRVAGDEYAQHPQVYSYAASERRPETSDQNGQAVLTADSVFTVKFTDQSSVPLWVLSEKRGLIAQEEVRRTEFDDKTVRTIGLQPACNVRGQVTSVGLWQIGRRIARTIAYPSQPGQQARRTLEGVFNGDRFEFLLPPGDFCLDVYGTNSYSAYRFIHIEPGLRELNLQLDLPIETIAELFGHPAPELRRIKGWKNGNAFRLADLHGKVVLLDFWGYWCGPCVATMPELMKLHDEFHEKGLVIVAVHDDSVPSIVEMDRRLDERRQKYWGGRDLPFLVALDGGGETHIPGSALTAHGATTAAYGITGFPTTLIIDRDGNVIQQVEVRDAKARQEIEKALRAGEKTGR